MSLGHTVKLMVPQFVKLYVKTNKHDAADTEAICEAVCSSGVGQQEYQHGLGALDQKPRILPLAIRM